MADILTLKWGTVKRWDFRTDKAMDLLRKWHALGASVSAMAQRDTPEQKELLCELIDAVDEVWNDWSGEQMTKEDAKKYVLEYRQ